MAFSKIAVLYFSMNQGDSTQGAAGASEPKYLEEARFLLAAIFRHFKVQVQARGRGHVKKEDALKLIKAKHAAFKDGRMDFEQILLDIVKDLDETARDTGSSEFFEELYLAIRCFERYDQAQSSIGMLAFTENMKLTEVMLRNFLKIKLEFDKYEPGLFNHLFIEDLLANEYVSYYGKKKLVVLSEGLAKAFDRHSIYKLLDDIKEIAEEEQSYRAAFHLLKGQLKRKYRSYLDIVAKEEDLKRYVTKVLDSEGMQDLPGKLIDKIILDLRKEFFYVNNILPVIKDGFGLELRDDFIRNSGLDKTYIEELERQYLNEQDRQVIQAGGGERI